jgi:hypothetical protein
MKAKQPKHSIDGKSTQPRIKETMSNGQKGGFFKASCYCGKVKKS